MPLSWTAIVPILMLIASNVFMTFAWYGQLKVEHRPLWLILLISWGIAFFEYCLAVPANRIGRLTYDPAELKALQEVITLSVFAVFSVTWLKEPVTPNHLVGFAFIALGAFFVFRGPF
ncbi:MAG TPA: DMT family protein [Phenylobacterium sp.]|uniref:DMT family protein n=1 Tax=Phenylobacterium sp. TaxID=1871053 RepID=UPI002C62BF67|nr:DMT family protein [Phenylobacterium sp.]HSV04842.1 DMT family protein [Phenylobacterium sp.]